MDLIRCPGCGTEKRPTAYYPRSGQAGLRMPCKMCYSRRESARYRAYKAEDSATISQAMSLGDEGKRAELLGVIKFHSSAVAKRVAGGG